MKKSIILLLFFTALLCAQNSISIPQILKLNFSQSTDIEKKNLILSKKEAKMVQKFAKAKLNSKIVRLYEVKKRDKVVGYGVLLRQRIRTKNANVLYIIDSAKEFKGVEIISFKEPLEYKPNKSWQKTFIGKNENDKLVAGRDIPMVSGATMSVRSLTDSARIALGILKLIQK